MKYRKLFLVSLKLLFDIASIYAELLPLTATQSKTIQPAEYAIDGNSSTCSLAGVGSDSTDLGWLQIDMGNPFLVTSVALTNTKNDYEGQYLQNFVVLVSKSNSTDVQSSNVCTTFNNGSNVPFGAQINLTCSPNPLVGRYVTIKRQGGFRQDAISLCEVQIIRNPSDGYIYLYNLPTYQRGVWNENGVALNSSRAVDLDFETCAQSVDPNNANGQWYIDLMKNYTINSVTVFNNKIGSPQYLSYFNITVGSTTDVSSQTLCHNYNQSVPPGENATITCNVPSVGRYLSITRHGSDNPASLYLCEIYIKGQIFVESASSESSTTSTTTASPSKSEASSIASSSSTTTTTTSSSSSKTNSSTIASSSSFSSFSSASSSPVNTTISSSDVGSSTTPVASPSKSDGEEKNKIIIICVVVIVGGLLLLAAAGVALFLLIRKKRKIPGLSTKTKDGRVNLIRPTVASKQKPSFLPLKETNVTVSETTEPVKETNISETETTASTKERLRQPILAGLLAEYVARKRSDKDGFKQEFEKLPKENMKLVTVGTRSENARRNRFKNILPYDHTQVPLEIDESDEPDANYINANFITGYKNIKKMYIASQGPKVETVVDFWRMIWQQNVDLIVMTTCVHEAGKKKCEQYWPDKVNETKKFNKISVQMTLEDAFANHVYREMTIHDERKKSDQPRKIRHMHFLKWEDKMRPEHYLPLLCFRKRVRELQRSTSGPVLVHCSAGVGRTGTYIALDILLEQLKHEGEISFFSCVEKLRDQRMNMVQTWKQYDFLHEALVNHFLTGETAIPCDTFLRDYTELILPKSNGSKLHEQFALLQKVKNRTTVKESAGRQHENLSKNRTKDILAYDDARLYLEANLNNESDYINAVYVDGYRSNEAYILTQLPLQETIIDFWRMIWDHRLKRILLLSEIESDDKVHDCPKYWPEDGDTETHGAIEIKATLTTEISPSIILREFTVAHKNERLKGPFTVRHYQVKGWPNEAIVPSSPNLLLGLIGELTGISSKDSVVIQCTDGATRSGLLAAAIYVIDMIKVEQVVDVFLACRFIAINRPQVISSQDQYKFLYDLASAYMNDTQDYSNTLQASKDNAEAIYANA